MMYLIAQLSVALIFTALFAALAGWAVAAARAAAGERAQKKERDGLVSDLLRMASGDAGQSNAIEAERQSDTLRRQLELRDGRIAELERTLAAARARADESESRLAEFDRRGARDDADAEELARLREQVASQQIVDVQPVMEDEELALQKWRMRYFEQRVRYLETPRAEPEPVVVEPEPQPPLLEWRAREAEARAAHLADELRARETPALEEAPATIEEEPPFAADAEVDVLLRWRLLYLERRVGYLQQDLRSAEDAARAAERGQVVAPAIDPDRWKWRARYLEARVRHLEERPAVVIEAPAPAPNAAEDEAAPPAQPAPQRTQKPPALAAARNGAPDDFTLIEGVSLLQQTTLYALGVFHFDQIAAWAPEHVAWVDRYLRLRGRIEEEEWVEQAVDLAREGPVAARRSLESEDA